MPREKFGLDEGGDVEVLNLKDEPESVAQRVDGRHAYPAYHMNKKHWYTIFLNDLVPDDEIIGMVEKSYELVNQ